MHAIRSTSMVPGSHLIERQAAFRFPSAVLAAFLLLVIPTSAWPDTATLVPVADNTLYENAAGDTSNGAGDHFFAGRTASGAVRRGLIAFDMGLIPPGSVIQSALLTLYMSGPGGGIGPSSARRILQSSAPFPVSLHRVLAEWDEGASVADANGDAGAPATPGDATWLHAIFDTVLWTAPGGDFDPVASDVQVVGDVNLYSWGPSAAMTADVQAWLDDPQSNFGWLLIGDESTADTIKRFDSRENGASVQPVLTVDYIPNSADLSMTITADDPAPGPGGNVTYRLSVENAGPLAATSVQIQAPLAAGLTFASALADRGGYDSATGVWSLGNVAVSETVNLDITAVVDAGTLGSVVTQAASVAGSDQVDPDPYNNAVRTDIAVSVNFPGDVDGDQDVDLADAVRALKIQAGVDPADAAPIASPGEVDVSGDGRIGIAEVQYAIQVAAGTRMEVVAPGETDHETQVSGTGSLNTGVRFTTQSGVDVVFAGGTRLQTGDGSTLSDRVTLVVDEVAHNVGMPPLSGLQKTISIGLRNGDDPTTTPAVFDPPATVRVALGDRNTVGKWYRYGFIKNGHFVKTPQPDAVPVLLGQVLLEDGGPETLPAEDAALLGLVFVPDGASAQGTGIAAARAPLADVPNTVSIDIPPDLIAATPLLDTFQIVNPKTAQVILADVLLPFLPVGGSRQYSGRYGDFLLELTPSPSGGATLRITSRFHNRFGLNSATFINTTTGETRLFQGPLEGGCADESCTDVPYVGGIKLDVIMRANFYAFEAAMQRLESLLPSSSRLARHRFSVIDDMAGCGWAHGVATIFNHPESTQLIAENLPEGWRATATDRRMEIVIDSVIALQSDLTGTPDIHLYDIEDGQLANLTDSPEEEYLQRWSSGACEILYNAETVQAGLLATELTTGHVRGLSTTPPYVSASPDLKKVVGSRRGPDRLNPAGYTVGSRDWFIQDRSGKRIVLFNNFDIRPNTNYSAARWSPDSTRTGFAAQADWTSASVELEELYIADTGGAVRKVTRFGQLSPGGAAVFEFQWSRDGTQIAVQTWLAADNTRNFFVWSEGGVSRLTNFSAPEGGAYRFAPNAWSPAGDRLLVYNVSDSTLYALAVPGGGQTAIYTGQIIPTALLHRNPTPRSDLWSPDGTQVLVPSVNEGLFVVNADGTGQQKILDAVQTADFRRHRFQWSPNGSRILFVQEYDPAGANAGNPSEIWVVNSDGTNAKMAVQGEDALWQPASD